MHEELEQKLFNRFNFYRPELPQTQSLMCFGIATGDGWFNIIWELSEKIEAILNDANEADHAKALLTDYVFNVVQVKEKFGTLRFYFDLNIDDNDIYRKIRDAVHEAEGKSAEVCENCGAPGKMSESGWRSVECDECRKNK